MATPPRQFAQAWVDAWNAKDLGAILSHYSDAVAFHSPRVAAAARARGAGGDASGRLVGKAQLGAYLQEALDKLGDVLSLTIQVRRARARGFVGTRPDGGLCPAAAERKP
jgi:ketosteroid isomerase-like protein